MVPITILSNPESFELSPSCVPTHYAGGLGGFCPYAIFRLAASKEGIHLQMTGFLQSPTAAQPASLEDEGDYLQVVLKLSGGSPIISILIDAFDCCQLQIGASTPKHLPCRRTTGEDERGIFWDTQVLLDWNTIQSSPSNITSPVGNCFTYSYAKQRPYFGACFPITDRRTLVNESNLFPLQIVHL